MTTAGNLIDPESVMGGLQYSETDPSLITKAEAFMVVFLLNNTKEMLPLSMAWEKQFIEVRVQPVELTYRL